MNWETQKQLVRDAIEKVFNIGDEKGVRRLSFSVELDPEYPPAFLYKVDSVLIGEILKNG